jgi:hypothetical protein
MNRLCRLLPAGLLLFTLILAGCAEGIRTYEVPVVKQRLLGAFIETDDGLWAFKLMGNADAVAEHKAQFDQFIKSVRLPGKGKEKIAWTLPASWEHETGNGMRYATLRLPKDLELTVFFFQGGGGDLLRNVNRWRDQLKLEPIRTRDLERVGKIETLANEQKVYLLDLESARMTPAPEEPTQSDGPVAYTKPEGWVEDPNRGQFADLAFIVGSDDKRARITLTRAGGALEANINRWRTEVGLPEINAQQMRDDVKETTVFGQPALLFDLVGRNGKSTLGVICPVGDGALFVKMMGDTEVVAKQKSAFEAFIASLKVRREK